MSDIELDKIRSGYNLQKINNNFEKIEEKINEEVLHTEGGNNVMSQDLDMNSNRIYNLPKPLQDSEAARLADVKELSGIDGQFSFVQEEVPEGSLLSGMRWFKPSTPTTFTYYVDPNGNGAWLQEPVQKGSVDGFKHNDLLERDSADAHPASSISTTGGSNVQAALDEKASTAEAKAGTNDSKKMTPLKTSQTLNDLGLGYGSSYTLPPVSDLNDFNRGFFKTAGSNTLNAPFGFAVGFTAGYGNLFSAQLAMNISGSRIAFRGYPIDSFTPWVDLYHESNLKVLQNASGVTLPSDNSPFAGSNLNPAQEGTWKNASGNDIVNNGYGLFAKVYQ